MYFTLLTYNVFLEEIYLNWIILICFSLIVVDEILLINSQSNLFLKPTSTEHWGQSFLLEEINWALMGLK